MQLIDGKATAAQIKAEIKEEVEKIVAQGGKRPHLAAILVGQDTLKLQQLLMDYQSMLTKWYLLIYHI